MATLTGKKVKDTYYKVLQVDNGQIVYNGLGSPVTGSVNLSGSFHVTGSQTVGGDLRVFGNVTAKQFIATTVSSSVIYESGSSEFGNSIDDTHTFTGSLYISNSIELVGDQITTGTLTLGDYTDVSASLDQAEKDIVANSASAHIARNQLSASAHTSRVQLSSSADIARLALSSSAHTSREQLSSSADIARLSLSSSADIARVSLSGSADAARISLSSSADIARLSLSSSADIARVSLSGSAHIDRVAKITTLSGSAHDQRVAISSSFASSLGSEITSLSASAHNQRISEDTILSSSAHDQRTVLISELSGSAHIQRIALSSSLRTYTDEKIAGLIDSAPATLDTLNEIAAAIGDNANVSASFATTLGTKFATADHNTYSSSAATAFRTEYTDGDTELSGALNTRIEALEAGGGTSGLSASAHIQREALSSSAASAFRVEYLDGDSVVNSNLNTYTSSNDIRLNLIEAATASIQSEVDSLTANTSSYITYSQTSSMTVLSSSYALTASHALNIPATASYAISGAYALTASHALNIPVTASYAISASYATSASYEITYELSSSYAETATSASYATTASYALNVQPGAGFPYTGSAEISGSLTVIDGVITGDGSGLSNLTYAQAATVVDTFSNKTVHTVTHNFGSKNIIAFVYDSNDNQILPAELTTVDDNNVTVTFDSSTSGRVVVARGGHIVSGSVEYSSILNKPTFHYVKRHRTETIVYPGGYGSVTIDFTTGSLDYGSTDAMWDSSTDRFTPTVAGLWYIKAQADSYNGATSEAGINIVKNGVIEAAMGHIGAIRPQVSTHVYMNGSTDYIQIQSYAQNSATRGQSAGSTFFEAKLVHES